MAMGVVMPYDMVYHQLITIAQASVIWKLYLIFSKHTGLRVNCWRTGN